MNGSDTVAWKTWKRAGRFGLSLLLLVLCGAMTATGQSGATAGEWRTFGRDLASTRYAPFDQINAANFNKLEIAWRFKDDNLGAQPNFDFQATPLMVHGVLYLTAGSRRDAVALDAATGEMLWMHSEREGDRGTKAVRQGAGRGLSYWTDGKEERILYVTPGYRMIALDARTGVPIPTFGKDGVVDLKLDDDQQLDPVNGEISLNATPLIAKDLVVVGSAALGGPRQRTRSTPKGNVRAFDVRTGKRRWIFHTIPVPGEFGNNTWEHDDWAVAGNTGVWAQMSVDEELGLLYLPVELPTGDFYGGHRRGNALFGESIVAVDLMTGKRKWHYQLVHHGLWDNDIPCAPILANITVDGRQIKALAQPTKQAWLYVLDRVTGKPVWPIEERPVEKGDIPGEWYSPTQPFVTKPPAYDRQGVSLDDLVDFTPALKAEAVSLASKYKLGPMFTPPVLSKWEGPRATLMLPADTGGANWPGGSYDPETGILYIFSSTQMYALGVIRNPDRKDSEPPDKYLDYVEGVAPDPSGKAFPSRRDINLQGLPLVKPPYGRITAINLNKGDIVWQTAHGETPDDIKNHPALKGVTIPRTGRPGRIGTLTTKTLVIAGEGGFATTPNGRGAMLRAYDKGTGQEVGAVYMPAPSSGSPMTYMLNGTQYIAVPVSGGNVSGTLVVFKLGA